MNSAVASKTLITRLVTQMQTATPEDPEQWDELLTEVIGLLQQVHPIGDAYLWMVMQGAIDYLKMLDDTVKVRTYTTERKCARAVLKAFFKHKRENT